MSLLCFCCLFMMMMKIRFFKLTYHSITLTKLRSQLDQQGLPREQSSVMGESS